MSLQGILFDLDGVLCSTDEFHFKAWQELAASISVPFDRSVNERLLGISRMASLDIVLEKSDKVWTQEEKEQLAARKNERYRELLQNLTPASLNPGVKQTLDTLRCRGVMLAVASSSRNAPYILERLGLGSFFDAVCDGSRITRAKPDPEVFLKAAELLGLSPKNCLVVEDAVAGAKAGHAGGFLVACVGDASKKGAGDWNLSQFSELLPICEALQRGGVSAERYTEWLAQPALNEDLKRELSAMALHPETIEDAFGCELQFGTGGLRGVLGAGTNRMNVPVVRRAAQAVADFVNAAPLPKRAAVGYDSRIGSRLFAEETACVFAANGIETHLYPRLEPVPTLSFAVRQLSCAVGVCITASHNPAQYNGFKVYGPDGCQLTPEGVAKIAENLKNRSYFDAIQTGDFSSLLEAGKIQWISDSVLDSFLHAVLSLRTTREDLFDLKLVYTPLNGSGRELAEQLFAKLGVRNYALVEEQSQPDGTFPTCPYPNPEIPEAMALGLSYCKRLHPDLLAGTDPDCDRCGVAAPDESGAYRLLTGNEVGVLLLDYVLKTRQEAGTLPEQPVVVTTIVSTDMAAAVCKKYGAKLRRTLTGFKFIGEQIGLLEREGTPDRFVFGFEESCGYLSGSHVRDKDGVNALLLVCEAAAFHKKHGRTLHEAMQALYREFGFFANGQESFAFTGGHAMEEMSKRMDDLRAAPPETVSGQRVTGKTDYLLDDTGLPRSDVLEFRLDSGAKLIVRPSGTEPKLKCYLSAKADSMQDAQKSLEALRTGARSLLHF